ncbi:N,N-dimethylformamidase beta subunit family domain-containing protein [Jiangella asiatica]|uniref:LamG domain-containing protein n=1 Tax=Jiangella asiatica TaxID=2530372 RepID=A0A4R5DJ77_9ACTN|nr:N,N-dimethylformamidase beta subunit family domain-containing protein [Jiangella asiatica]TDE10603.1 LamG domain-containing protein [Jiangella asiatica]
MEVVAYTDKMGAAAGERVSVMVSAVDPKVQVSLVRLSGASLGAGGEPEACESAVDGTYASSPQSIVSGSYVVIEDDPRLRIDRGFSVTLWVMPTLLSAGAQALISKSDRDGRGWAIGTTAAGRVRADIAGAEGEGCIESSIALRDHAWHFVGFTFDGVDGWLCLLVRPVGDALTPSVSTSDAVWTEAPAGIESVAGVPEPLLIAGARRRDARGLTNRTFNGKIAMPRLFGRPLSQDEVMLEAEAPAQPHNRPVVAAWDFAQDIPSERVVDVSGNGLDGRTVQMPTRAVTGPRWDGSSLSWRERPELYDAIHFHDDDLDDAGWEPTASFDIDDALSSGIYAIRVEGTTSGIDFAPIVVRPRPNGPRAQVLFVAPLFSWLAYGNWRASYASAAEHTDRGRYAVECGLSGLYDRHSDASSVCHASWLRPNLHIRPDYRLGGDPHQLTADLLITDWLQHEGVHFDVITDEDLDREGADLLRRYRVVISGAHAEYWSAPMLDGLAGYLEAGGRYMYLSGNGLYRVTAMRSGGHTVEVRRQDASGLDAARHAAAGEGHISFTGEPGGAWRWRGRPPQRYVGVGMSGLGFSEEPDAGPPAGSPYRRQPGSFDPRGAFIFAGIEDDELIGAFPNVIHRYGAAGFEVDRADHALGTPRHALVLASAVGEPRKRWTPSHDDEEDAVTLMSEVRAVTRRARSDLVFFETASGGAVFATGSISWSGALAHNDYGNNVATLSRNVLRRFLSTEPFTFPAQPAPTPTRVTSDRQSGLSTDHQERDVCERKRSSSLPRGSSKSRR